MINPSFQTLASFDSYIDAHLLLNRLQAEGVTCFLKDEFTVTIDPILTNAIGGIKIVVPETEFQTAQSLMNNWQNDANKNAACPKCGKQALQLVSSAANPSNVLSGLFGFVFGNYAFAVKKEYKCFSCGAVFEALPDNEWGEKGSG